MTYNISNGSLLQRSWIICVYLRLHLTKELRSNWIICESNFFAKLLLTTTNNNPRVSYPGGTKILLVSFQTNWEEIILQHCPITNSIYADMLFVKITPHYNAFRVEWCFFICIRILLTANYVVLFIRLVIYAEINLIVAVRW